MMIIVIEGIDASGKETQSDLLTEWLREEEYSVFPVSFPRYHTPIGKIIKDYLIGNVDITEETFHMLLEADRQDFMETVEWLLHEDCDFIVLDRFVLSNLAFGKAKGLDVEWLKSLQKKVIKPDLTFFIDVSVEASLERRKEGRDKHEQDLELLGNARNAYLDLVGELREDDEYAYRIDGHLSVQEIHKQIREIVISHLS